jgi:hypothetical protein
MSCVSVTLPEVAVAVTVKAYVPAGVPGWTIGAGVELPPPHAGIANAPTSIAELRAVVNARRSGTRRLKRTAHARRTPQAIKPKYHEADLGILMAGGLVRICGAMINGRLRK